MGNLKIKKVTYFVNFELNRRFEAAKFALAQQGRDDTERTCVNVKLFPLSKLCLRSLLRTCSLFHGTPEVNVQPILEVHIWPAASPFDAR